MTIRESTGDWRWSDDAAIPGSTPRRLAGLVKDIKALAFHDKGVKDIEISDNSPQIKFTLGEDSFELTLGRQWEIPPVDERARPDQRQYLRVSGTIQRTKSIGR